MTDDLRSQIRRACAEADGFNFDGLEAHDYQRHADVILALVQPIADERDQAETQAAEHKAWRQHFLRTTIEASEMVRAVQELHQPETFGGLPTGRCASCNEPMPCHTRQLVPRKSDEEPCRCSRECPAARTTLDNPLTSTNTVDNPKEQP